MEYFEISEITKRKEKKRKKKEKKRYLQWQKETKNRFVSVMEEPEPWALRFNPDALRENQGRVFVEGFLFCFALLCFGTVFTCL